MWLDFERILQNSFTVRQLSNNNNNNNNNNNDDDNNNIRLPLVKESFSLTAEMVVRSTMIMMTMTGSNGLTKNEMMYK